LHNRLAPLTASLCRESPAALKYALSLLGLMRPNTRLPIVELDDAAKSEVATAIAAIGDKDLACLAESRHASRCLELPSPHAHRAWRGEGRS
jgi:4-hydroxy-tetrahydrodipicolinate synthase